MALLRLAHAQSESTPKSKSTRCLKLQPFLCPFLAGNTRSLAAHHSEIIWSLLLQAGYSKTQDWRGTVSHL